MNKVEKIFVEDFNSSDKIDLKFDLNQLEANKVEVKCKARFNKKKLFYIIPCCCVAACVLVVVGGVLINSLDIDTSPKMYKRKYTMNEIQMIENNSFKKLNSISYPNQDHPRKSVLTEEEEGSYSNFSNLTYHSLVNTSKSNNMSYSVIGLYSVMNDLYNGASNETLREKMDTLLGLSKTQRIGFYEKAMYANSYAIDESSIQLKNAMFLDNCFRYSEDYVNSLANLYCEAYQLDLSTDLNKIVEWANEAVNENNFIDNDFLGMDEHTVFYLLSTLYFKNAWNNKYLSSNNKVDDFYLNGGATTQAEYMYHSYYIDKVYDYGDYVSVKDHYYNGYASITYIVPKEKTGDIYALTSDKNIFVEDEESAATSSDPYERGVIVNLKTPKFTSKCDVDFHDCLENLGFGDIYDDRIPSFNNIFNSEDVTEKNIYIQAIKQRNQVEFSEDGTIIKSVTMARGGDNASAGPMDSIDVNLDRPFIYIIKDVNDMPIFVGHIDNPKV